MTCGCPSGNVKKIITAQQKHVIVRGVSTMTFKKRKPCKQFLQGLIINSIGLKAHLLLLNLLHIISIDLREIVVGVEGQQVEAIEVFGKGEVIEGLLEKGNLLFIFNLVK